VNLFGNRRKMNKKPAQTGTMYNCDSCGKTFTKSLKMLDFDHKPPKEIDICPFCDKTLTK